MHGGMIEDRRMMRRWDSAARGVVVGSVGVKLTSRRFQFAPQNAYMPRSIECHSDPIAGDPSDLQHDVVPHVNPFTNLST